MPDLFWVTGCPVIHFDFLLKAYLVFFFLRSGIQFFLNRLNTSFLRRHGGAVPDFFRDALDAEKVQKITAYTAQSANFGLAATLVDEAVFLLILLSGFLPWLVDLLRAWGLGGIPAGLAFFAVLGGISRILHLPFSLYGNFVLEARYGFNRKTLGTWAADLVKGLVLSAALGGLILGLFLLLVAHGGKLWWLWAWLCVGAIELLVIWLYPLLIAPLFNKFIPLEDPEMVRRITGLMQGAGLKARGVFQMDASRRSGHTNAYFTGLGKSKRIVLFDTLLASHTPDEILGVLAHEVGHWKKRHVLLQLILAEILALVVFYGVARLLNWQPMYQTFGFADTPAFAGLFLIGALFSPLGYFLQPLGSALARRLERQADDFALALMKDPMPLANALKRLAADNLANLTPHPLYAWFYYSHPPLPERVARLLAAKEDKSP